MCLNNRVITKLISIEWLFSIFVLEQLTIGSEIERFWTLVLTIMSEMFLNDVRS